MTVLRICQKTDAVCSRGCASGPCKLDDTTETRSAPDLRPIDSELAMLGEVVHVLNAFDTDTRARTFRYLKDRFSKEWPAESY